MRSHAHSSGVFKLVLLAALVSALIVALAASSGQSKSGGPEIDSALKDKLGAVGKNSPVTAILTYEQQPTAAEVESVSQTGVAVHDFDQLPMLAVRGTKGQIQDLYGLEGISSISANQRLQYTLDESRPLVGADRAASELGVTGKGVGVAVIDSGIDGTHPDLKYPEKTV